MKVLHKAVVRCLESFAISAYALSCSPPCSCQVPICSAFDVLLPPLTWHCWRQAQQLHLPGWSDGLLCDLLGPALLSSGGRGWFHWVTHKRMHARLHARMHARMHAHARTHARMHAHARTHARTRTQASTHTHIHTHTHTPLRPHTSLFACLCNFPGVGSLRGHESSLHNCPFSVALALYLSSCQPVSPTYIEQAVVPFTCVCYLFDHCSDVRRVPKVTRWHNVCRISAVDRPLLSFLEHFAMQSRLSFAAR